MVVDIVKGILVVVVGVPAVAVLWTGMKSTVRSTSYIVNGGIMTVFVSTVYYFFNQLPMWSDAGWEGTGLRVFFGAFVAVAYGVGFAIAKRNKIATEPQSVDLNE